MTRRRAVTTTARRSAARIAASLLLAGLACDGRSWSAAPSGLCREAGAQCQLPEGPLGVCERHACNAGEPDPCFLCIPQH